jgi:molybdenum cofactor biosynthesis protein B
MGHDPHDHDHNHPHDHDHSHSHPHSHSHDHSHPRDHDHDHDHEHEHHSAVVDEHHQHAAAQVATYVITCSDTRTPQSDDSGSLLRSLLEKAGHTVVGQSLVKDDAAALRKAIESAVEAGARAVVLTGGTGIATRDVTIEVVSALFEKRIDGFGELFRMLSFHQIGPAAMLSRAAAGTWHGAVIFALPGSPHAVKLALERLILPELGHLLRELTR